nr:TonB-dependent receptor [Pyrinomonadaceae bacterium]
IKFGADFNWINVDAKFELNFPGLFNFGQQSCGSLITGCAGPAFTPIQAYGLGFPSVFIQGFGDPGSQVRNRPIAFFAQDTWRMFKNVTVNYGVRYDVELTEEFAPTPFRDPLTGITLSAQDVQTAQDALNVTQGFPRDNNNIAPRLGAAWDVTGDGKTVIRGAIGMFYDHPLLAVAFNSDVADGSQQQQSTLLPIGGPSPTGLFNAFQVFHGTAIPGVTPGLAASAQYLQGFQRFNPNTFTGFGPILPFTLPVGKDFEYPYAIQGNLAIERQLGKNTIVSASYITVNARHLAHPQDVNNVQSNLLIDNFRRFAGRAPTGLAEAAFFSLPQVCTPTTCPPGYTVVVPGFVGRNGLGQTVVSPIAANFFRKLGPNYFFVKALTGLDKPVFDSLLAGSLRTPGPINSYADVNAQLSDGNSSYNALNLEMKKRFSTNIQFLASYTWSHSIDDSSDLQTLLKPQDNTNFRAERSDSLFDQRHRFVFSGVISSPENWRSGGGGYRRFLSDFTIAPIIELSSGRPFNILTVNDANGDFQSSNERPSVLPDGSLCSNLVDCPAGFSTFPVSGNLGRNRGITHNYFSLDMRLTRRIRFGERVSLDLIAEGFNLFNRFNEAAANPFYQVVNAFGERSKGGKYFSEPTSAFDPRQFQFGMKFNF